MEEPRPYDTLIVWLTVLACLVSGVLAKREAWAICGGVVVMSLSVGYATYRYGWMEMGGLCHVSVGGILALGFFYIKRWVLEYRETRETKD